MFRSEPEDNNGFYAKSVCESTKTRARRYLRGVLKECRAVSRVEITALLLLPLLTTHVV